MTESPHLRSAITTATGCRVRLIDGNAWPHLVQTVGEGVMLTLDVDDRHAEVYLDKGAMEIIGRGLRISKPRLGYKKSMQCVGHEIAPDSHPEEAEMIVAGFSFCYPCGNTTLGILLDGDAGLNIADVVRMFRDGIIAVTE